MKSKLCGLIGYPVKHSLSPGMHKIAFKELGLTDWDYILIEAENSNKLNESIKSLISRGFAGFNVTVPYKQEIIKYLTHISSDAKKIGAVNTVVNKNGILYGYNTDSYGFMIDLKESLDFKGESAIVLGAGGAARAVVSGLKNFKVEHIFVFDINKKQLVELKNSFTSVLAIEKKDINILLSEVDIVVNATPVGMKEGDSAVINLKNNQIKDNLKVYDVIYNRKTELLRDAEKLCLKTADGTGMLLYQGIKAFELWTEKKVTEEVKEKMRNYIKGE